MGALAGDKAPTMSGDEMKRLVGAAAMLFALAAPTTAGAFDLPKIPCVIFCDAKPTPTPSPTAHAADAKPLAAPRELHPVRGPAAATPAVEPKRVWRPAHPNRPVSASSHPQPAVASAPHPVATPSRPAPVASAAPVAAPTAVAAQSDPIARMLSSTDASVAPPSDPTPPSAAADSHPVEHAADPATRLLSEAFAEQPPPAPTPVPTPAPPPPKPTAVAAPPSATFAMVEPAQPSAFVQVTANGLVFPWWPSSFPGRAAVWIIVLAVVAAAAFGVAIASGRRVAV